jgi:iron complex transport system substrate-binding protein
LTRFAPICALIVAALLGTACGERSDPVGTIAQTYPVSVHGAGDRRTVLKARAERIVALEPGLAESLVAIGAGDRLVGVPDGLAKGPAADAREVVRRTGQVDVDGVIKLKPDLIVATQSIDELDLARAQQRESGAAVYVQPDTSVLNVEQGIIDLGFLTGEASRARELVGKIERQVSQVEDRMAEVAPVSVFVDTGFFITVPERSLLGDLVRIAKGESVAGASPGQGPFPLGQLVKANPDVYLATSDAGVTLPSLRHNHALSKLRAVRKGRVAIVPVGLVTRPGARVGEGLMAVAKALHPDAFR